MEADQSPPRPFGQLRPTSLEASVDKREPFDGFMLNTVNDEFAEEFAKTDARPLILSNPSHGWCSGAEILTELRDAGRLVGHLSVPLRTQFGEGAGTCFSSSGMLFLDLVVAGKAAGWTVLSGKSPTPGKKDGIPRHRHAWLEYDGWAFDVGRGLVIYANNAAVYRNVNRLRNVKVKSSGARIAAEARASGADPAVWASHRIAEYQAARLAEVTWRPGADGIPTDHREQGA